MTDEKKKLNPKEEALKLLKEKKKKVNINRQLEIYKQLATRDIIERDFKEDTVIVPFQTAPGIKRNIKARRPTHEEMITLMKLTIEASKFEGNPQAMEQMIEIYEKLPKLASSLSVDKSMTEDWWKHKVSFTALQDFITQLIIITQRGTEIPEENIQSFR